MRNQLLLFVLNVASDNVFLKVPQLLEDTVSICSVSTFFILLMIFMHLGHVLHQSSYLASPEFLVVFQYFKAVSKSVPSFYLIKNVLLLSSHEICHFGRTVIVSSFLLGIREQKDVPDNMYQHKLSIHSYVNIIKHKLSVKHNLEAIYVCM